MATMRDTPISGYHYNWVGLGLEHARLLPAIDQELNSLPLASRRAFDLGCGNGAVADWFAKRGFEVQGVDPSSSGIALAHRSFPHLDLREGSAYDPLVETFDTFPLVVSLEVIEHVYAPRAFAACAHDLLEPGGYLMLSTPYHGYLKNVALAVSGRMDTHFTALWDHGHIKFWSRKTITRLLEEAGLTVERIRNVGRISVFARSMLVIARKASDRLR
jgi:2-polyprenyl-6-hydroxyphenyl methylase/3-demethylubiquinone-9 3-methyltransferase